jgi:hypothetical protein
MKCLIPFSCLNVLNLIDRQKIDEAKRSDFYEVFYSIPKASEYA